MPTPAWPNFAAATGIRGARPVEVLPACVTPPTPEPVFAAEYGPFDLLMLEVGAFHPAWGSIHLGPAQALEAHAARPDGARDTVRIGMLDAALCQGIAERLLQVDR
mgnify:CR=1 FL=1